MLNFSVRIDKKSKKENKINNAKKQNKKLEK